MSGGGTDLSGLLGAAAPLALMAIPGVGDALGPMLASSMGVGTGTADALSSGLMGAAIGGGTSALTGGNPLKAALMGGIGAGLGSELLPTPGAAGAAGTSGVASNELVSPAVAAADPSLSAASGNASLDNTLSQIGNNGVVAPSSSDSTGIGGYLSKQNPLSLALAGGAALSGIQSLLPHKQVNVGQNAANVMGTNPGFNASLPQYNMQNTATPYQGNWYTYGETPQTALYNARPTPAKHGGLMGYKHGGKVHGYAMGGQPMMPSGAPTQGSAPQAMPPQANPLMLAAAHKVGVAIGQHLRKNQHTPLGRVAGQGGGQDDIVPAKLSKDEYVLSADVPAALGDGSSEAGAKKLDQFVKNIRAHKTSKGSSFPPKAKNPLSYLPKGNV